MIYAVIKWTAVVMAAWVVLRLPIQIRQWLAVRRLYGKIPWSLVRQMQDYMNKTAGLWFQPASMKLLVVWIVGIAAYESYAGPLEFDGVRHSVLLPHIVLFAWMLERVANVALPPSMLFLGTSRQETILMLSLLRRPMFPYRPVSLMEPHQHVPNALFPGFFYNNLRTRHEHEWRTVVHHLMDVVPLIVFDADSATEHVIAERNRAAERGLLYKTQFFRLPWNSSPADDERPSTTDDLKMARKAADDLGALVCAFLRERPTDIERRDAMQREYTAMRKAVPRRIRNNPDINAMLIKAHFLSDWQYRRYLSDCKGISPEQVGSRHLEEIPSIVLPDAERRYLDGSRAYEECENIAIGALELAEKTPGEYQSFNIANAHNKLGKYARLRRDWDKAGFHLKDAIWRLEAMVREPGPAGLKSVKQELSDAHYLLGEVLAGRFADTGHPFDKKLADEHWQISKKLDQELAAMAQR